MRFISGNICKTSGMFEYELGIELLILDTLKQIFMSFSESKRVKVNFLSSVNQSIFNVIKPMSILQKYVNLY